MAIATVNSVSVSANQRPKRQIEYQKTNAFKLMGAITGGVIGIAAPLGTAAAFAAMEKEPIKGGKLALITAGCAVVGAGLGTLCGVMKDFTINKTVKNTTVSVLNNLA